MEVQGALQPWRTEDDARAGAVMPRVKPPHAMPRSHMNAGFSPGSCTSHPAPC